MDAKTKKQSESLADCDCGVCNARGVVSATESCACTTRTFPDWKGQNVTKKPSDDFYWHDYRRRPG